MHADAVDMDFETGSQLELGNQKSIGVHKYALHPSTRVWVLRYSFGDGLVFEWRPGMPDPERLLDHIRRGGTVVAHNAMFERIIWNWLCRRHYPHWPELPARQMRCTMAKALHAGMSGKLDTVASALNTAHQKDMDGHKLMMKMSKPRATDFNGTLLWHDTPENITRLSAYCADDVRTEQDVDKLLPHLPPDEQDLWEFDQLINDRGVKFDRTMAEKAVLMVELAKKNADRMMRQLTDGAVRKCSEVGKIVEWLHSRGIIVEALRKNDFDDIIAIAGFVDDTVAQQVLELRRAASKTSTTKFRRIVECMLSDDRVRGLLQYFGAHTGRWSGRLVQPQNFPRVDPDTEQERVDLLVSLMTDHNFSAAEVVEAVELLIGPALVWLSKALRACIIADHGKKLVGGDYSNIEGRINAWISGEQWKLDAFSLYDTILGYDAKGVEVRAGPDLYRVAYSRSFGLSIEAVTKPQRQIGKVQELALGYQGSVGAFISMGVNYGVQPRPIADAVRKAVSEETWEATRIRYKSARDKHGLSEYDWTGIKIVVNQWRAAHPLLVQSWWDMQDAAIEAVDAPGNPVWILDGRVAYLSDGGYLYCRLPSNRVLHYRQPFIVDTTEEMVKLDGEWFPVEMYDDETLKLFDDFGFEFRRRNKRSLRFYGSHEGRWGVQFLYGGVQSNNIVQATARDIMRCGMRNVESLGYTLILTVHDELLSEVPEDFGNPEEFKRAMSRLEPWMHGIPLSAAAWEGPRYTK